MQCTQAVKKRFERIKYPCGVCDAQLLATDFSLTLSSTVLAFKKIVKDVIDSDSCRQYCSCINRLESGGGEILCMSCEPLKGTSPLSDFSLFPARGVAAILRSLTSAGEPASLVVQSNLFAQCQWLADHLGSNIAYTFARTGLQGEDMQGPPQPPPEESRGTHTRSRSRTPTRSTRQKRNSSGFLKQGGDGAEDRFEMLSKMDAAAIFRNYKQNILGGKIPKGERPSVTQLSSVKAKPMDDVNPAPDVAVFGPFGDRTARAMSHVEDVHVGGSIVKRTVTGPTTLVEWIACWRVFRTCMLALQASPPAPLDAFQKKQKVFDALCPGRYGILAHATHNNLMEEWPNYREEVEVLVRKNQAPDYWCEHQAWGAAI